MNISYNWLKELISIELSPEETAAALTRVGLAVEGIHAHKDDFVLDVDLTSNRPDCLSHLGVARELSVITGQPVFVDRRRNEERLPDAPFPSILAPDFVKVEAADLCYRFTARLIRGVTIGPSPQWLIDRLEAIGERSINNVADITNFVMHEIGQPMHAFDLNTLAEHRIVVRRAKAGESITTLDEADRKLDDSMLMICDAEKPVAVGGVMGGLATSITDRTTDVLLEVAYFDRASIRQTSRRLNLNTEASYRFERGVDIENLKQASDRATQLICELAVGQAGEFIDVYPKRVEPGSVVSADVSRALKRLTGLEAPIEDCVRILTALGIAPDLEAPGTPRFSVPTWRHDVAIEEDLVEEVARHVGYESIREEVPPSLGAGEYQRSEPNKRSIRRSLSAAGFGEAIGYSFIDTKHDDRFEPVRAADGKSFVTLQDSVIEGAVRMRPSLLPGLLEAVRLNLNHQRRDLRLFEIGKVFFGVGDGELPLERELFATVITGGYQEASRAMATRELDFFDLKGAVETALSEAGVTRVNFDALEVRHLRPGQSASIALGESVIGYIGRLNEEIATDYKFKQPVFVAEFDLAAALASSDDVIRYSPLPRFPSVSRDVSFAADKTTSFEALRSSAVSSGGPNLRAVDFVDVFEGKGVGQNERSLTLRFHYRSDERTLVEDEVNEEHSRILASVEKLLGVKPRF